MVKTGSVTSSWLSFFFNISSSSYNVISFSIISLTTANNNGNINTTCSILGFKFWNLAPGCPITVRPAERLKFLKKGEKRHQM